MIRPLTLLPLVLLMACQPQKEEKNGVISNGSNTDGTSSGSGGGTTYGTTTDTFGTMFVTDTTVPGGYGYHATNPSYMKFDDLCASEATSKGYSGTFKAFINTLARKPCTSGDCNTSGAAEGTKWVLKANTLYKRPDGTEIGTTNSKSIFDFPLTNSITSSSKTYWSGFASYWTYPVGDSGNCARFTYAGSYNGPVGDSGSTTYNSLLTNPIENCNNSHSVLCVKILASTTTYAPQPSYRRIFVTTGTRTALASPAKSTLDGLCQTEANAKGIDSDGKTKFKALILKVDVTNSDRREVCGTASCTTANAYDWPLEAGREYRRLDKTTVIGTANSVGYFDYPLTNSITGDSTEYWTGIPHTWATTSAAEAAVNCSGWNTQTNSVHVSAFYGVGNQVDQNAISEATKRCDSSLPFLCVEQTRPQDSYSTFPGYSL